MSAGKLELIIGPMFSGKTTELINRFNRYQEITDEIFLVNHSSDKRYGKNLVVVHNEHQKCNTTHFVERLDQLCLDKKYKFTKMIFIDESQFFPDLLQFIKMAVNTHKKHVIVAGLIGDYQMCPFGDILNLIPIADDVKIVYALCKKCADGTQAPFTKRHNTRIEGQVAVGGSDIYEATCRKCYFD